MGRNNDNESQRDEKVKNSGNCHCHYRQEKCMENNELLRKGGHFTAFKLSIVIIENPMT